MLRRPLEPKLSIATPLVFFCLILFMLGPKVFPGMPELKGGDAAALVGGTAALMMLVATFAADGAKAMHTAADHIIDGLVFSFRAMGTVLPIAGFFSWAPPRPRAPSSACRAPRRAPACSSR